jgi:hypothetical protein
MGGFIVCANCGKLFFTPKHYQKFCSLKCGIIYNAKKLNIATSKKVILTIGFMFVMSSLYLTKAEQLLGVDTTHFYPLQLFAKYFLMSGLLFGVGLMFVVMYWNKWRAVRSPLSPKGAKYPSSRDTKSTHYTST